MSRSRKVLDAERKRSERADSHSHPNDGYLKHDRAFPNGVRRPPTLHPRNGDGVTPNEDDASGLSDSSVRCQHAGSGNEFDFSDVTGSGEKSHPAASPPPFLDTAEAWRQHYYPQQLHQQYYPPQPQPTHALRRPKRRRLPSSAQMVRHAVSPVPRRLRADALTPPLERSHSPLPLTAGLPAPKTGLTSPPLRAAVSPRPRTWPPHDGASPHERDGFTPVKATGGEGMEGNAQWPLLPPPAHAVRSPRRHSLTRGSGPNMEYGGYAPSRSPRRTAEAAGLYRRDGEHSGFVNPGYDCYACSVLTLLLRSPVFCRALLAVPTDSVEGELEAEDYTDYSTRLHMSRSYFDSGRSPLHRGMMRRNRNVHTILQEFARQLDRPEVIYAGLSMSPLQSFFPQNFFSGEQEDAHEFFVVLMAKLEEEAIEMAKAQAAAVAATSTKSDSPRPETSEDEEERDAERLFRGDADSDGAEAHHADTRWTKERRHNVPAVHASSTAKLDDGRNIVPLFTTNTTSEDALGHIRDAIHATTSTSPTPTSSSTKATSANAAVVDPTRIWINSLIQGKLLNIIRCRNKGCGHEIVTEEAYVNVSANLLKPSSKCAPLSECTGRATKDPQIEETQMTNHMNEENDEDYKGAHTPPTHSPMNHQNPSLHEEKRPIEKIEKEQVAEEEEEVYDVQSLLENSLRFNPLDTYVCDVCSSSQHQHQGGCLSGTVPPILVVQLNRFATSYNPDTGMVTLSKDKTAIRVNDELIVYSLITEGQYDKENKRFESNVRRAECAATSMHLDGPSCVDANDRKGVSEANCLINATRCRYRLQGVLLHLGSTQHAGHYVTEFAAESTSKSERSPRNGEVHGTPTSSTRVWKKADDSWVTSISAESLAKRRGRSTTCYLLLYEKVEEEELMCHVWDVLPREEVMLPEESDYERDAKRTLEEEKRGEDHACETQKSEQSENGQMSGSDERKRERED